MSGRGGAPLTTAFIPYWLIPGAQLLPSQQEFNNDLDLLNTKLEELVTKAFDDIANMDESNLQGGRARKLLRTTKSSTRPTALPRDGARRGGLGDATTR